MNSPHQRFLYGAQCQGIKSRVDIPSAGPVPFADVGGSGEQELPIDFAVGPIGLPKSS